MSLKDELLKAKLIGKKQLKQLEHEARLEQKQLGRDGLREKREAELKAIADQQEEKRLKDQQQAQAENEQRIAKEKLHRIEEIVKQGKLPERIFGDRKFYFTCRSKIRSLNLTDSITESLEHGTAAIIEVGEPPDNDFTVVNQHAASQLLKLQPEIVCFYQHES